MILHRAWRDTDRCAKKYGADWDEYKRQVPYLFIPVSISSLKSSRWVMADRGALVRFLKYRLLEGYEGVELGTRKIVTSCLHLNAYSCVRTLYKYFYRVMKMWKCFCRFLDMGGALTGEYIFLDPSERCVESTAIYMYDVVYIYLLLITTYGSSDRGY